MNGTNGSNLPPAFADLAPFVEWIEVATQSECYLKRQHTPYDAIEAFHRAMAPRLEAVFAHLDHFDDRPLPDAELRLYRMALGLIEAAQAVEIFGAPAVPHAPMPHHVAMSDLTGVLV